VNLQSALQVLYGECGSIALILAKDNKSTHSAATAHNAGRAIEIDGSSYQYRHLVFSSGSEIFYRRKPVWTSIWGEPVHLSLGNQENDFPNLSVQDNGRIIVCWQRKVNADSKEIWIAKSDDNGATWDSDDIYILTTVSITSDPLPVVQADYDGSYFDIVFRNNDGLKSYTSSDGEVWYGTTFINNNNPGDSSPSLANDWAFGNTCMVYETATKEIYYRWRLSYLGYNQNWSYRTNLSSIIPGDNFSHIEPSIATNPSGEGYDVHIVWHRISGSPKGGFGHEIIYRHGDDYYPYDWQNEYTVIYYWNQQRPIVTATDDYIYIYYQLVTNDYIYRQRNDGYGWTGPEYVANGRYPSISTGKSTALPAWTSNSSSPYEVKIGSQSLTKINIEQLPDPRDYYSRSIAILDSMGNYIELIIKDIYFKKDNGSSVKLPLKRVSLDTFNFSINNCWELQSTELITVPEDADSLLVNYEIRTLNYDKLSSNNFKDHKIHVNVYSQNGKLLSSIVDLQLSEEYIKKSESRTSRQYINHLKENNIKVTLSLNNLVTVEKTFASLGHIYYYNTIGVVNEKTAYAVFNSSIISNDKTATAKLQLFPNPFNSQVQIKFSLSESQHVALRIYNIRGQLVNTVVSDFLNKGHYTFKFNGSYLASGIYLVELQTEAKRIVNRMLLIK
jgi:hypothetical protein